MDLHATYDVLDLFGHRWTLEILASLTGSPKRYTDLQRSIDLVHAKSFNEALHRLVDNGLVSHPSSGDGSRYALTAMGRRAIPSIATFVTDLGWHNGTASNQGGAIAVPGIERLTRVETTTTTTR